MLFVQFPELTKENSSYSKYQKINLEVITVQYTNISVGVNCKATATAILFNTSIVVG